MKKKYIKPASAKVELNMIGSVLDSIDIGIDTNSYHKAEYSGEDQTGDAKSYNWDNIADFEPWQDNDDIDIDF